MAASSRPDETGATTQATFAQFSDIPVPEGARMDLERSLVLGEREAWIGRLVMAVSQDASRLFDFYFREMPRFDWAPVTTIRAEISVLSYTRGDRVATIQIRDQTIRGATVSITISPKGQPAKPVPSAPSMPGGPVEMTPLR